MPAPAHIPSSTRRAPWRVIVAIVVLSAVALTATVAATPAHAASQGVGFGTWAPASAYGWHGSMLIGGIHTYCILPGAPAPTGASTDRGVSTTAAGLTAKQLTGINHLVTAYGQTDDPIQAAGVGWAVKAIADWDETLHHFGYRGDSLAGAVHWTFSALAPAHSAEVQRLAVAYYEEAMGMDAGAISASGTIVFTTDAEDHRLGTVRVDATTASAVGTLTLQGARFADSDSSVRTDAVPGIEYPIVTTPSSPGRPHSVSATGVFTMGESVAAVRHFTTSGGQDTAGPAGELVFEVEGADAAARVPLFAPTIATQVGSAYVSGGAFVDDVHFAGSIQDWPRAEDGSPLPVTATAEVYRTISDPTLTGGRVPPDAVHVGSLGLTTDAAEGPTRSYRVTSLWELAQPGFYTAVWTVRIEGQVADVARHLPPDYVWTEQFGEPSQITMVPAVSSLAEPLVDAGATMSDKIIVAGPVPADGLTVTSAVYRAVQGVAPAESCGGEAHVWTSDPHLLSAPGEHVVVSPPISEPGTYYWQERAVDSTGEVVHLGRCGVAHETTRVRAVESPRAATPDRAPSVLAATGGHAPAARVGATVGVALLAGGAGCVLLTRLRRHAGEAEV